MKLYTTTPDRDELGLNQSKLIERDRIKKLERDAGGKPLRTFPYPALAAAAALLISAAPLAPAHAQTAMDNGVDTTAVVTDHGDWTLKQREDWLYDRLSKASDDGSLDHHEYERVRHELADIRSNEDDLRGHHDGQLTDNETAQLESRLDGVANQIHWLHDNNFRKPW